MNFNLLLWKVGNTIISLLGVGFSAYIFVEYFEEFSSNVKQSFPFLLAFPIFLIGGLGLWIEMYGKRFGYVKIAALYLLLCFAVFCLFRSIHL